MGLAASLEIMTGDRAGARHAVSAGAALRVGRVAPAEVLILDDPLLSALHFAIECTTNGCRIKDLGSRFGTFRRGERIEEADLRDGDVILAGRTRFALALAVDGSTPPPSISSVSAPVVNLSVAAPLPRAPARPELREWFRTLTKPLFAVLDSAREPTIPDKLDAAGEEHQSLFEGDRGKQLAPYGPWLARVHPGTPFLDELLADGWGQSWGVYLTCDSALSEVRKHLRRFLLVKLPDGRQVYFRYYDPRVLRTYLQTCTPKELTDFFGPVGQYIAESGDEGKLLVFASSYRDWHKVVLGR